MFFIQRLKRVFAALTVGLPPHPLTPSSGVTIPSDFSECPTSNQLKKLVTQYESCLESERLKQSKKLAMPHVNQENTQLTSSFVIELT